jgi:tetratricopeptide (TPR) repeat protein
MKGITLNRILITTGLISIILICGFSLQMSNSGENRKNRMGDLTVREAYLTIPTYLTNPPNPMPRFYEGRSHQGVQRRMYPYPMNDQLTRVKEDRDYRIIYLENEYIKVGIMPDLGGRIYSAVDKTNGYDFFYRNNVIKPSLIGMQGYWISGGNAWGYPHHHGANTVEPMDYTIEKNADGSATVWMSHVELLHRLRILIGFTIYPNSSVIDMTIRPFNPTPYVHSFLFWSNPSVHADTNYQVIFPPSVEYITQHHKNEMTTWPIADRYYNRFDYTGMDISMWKSTGVPSSFFSWDPKEDFFGGYDHGRESGTAWIGNRFTMPGMKYWADGNNPAGKLINSGLTDDDGSYIELMAGAFTDNQPDYSWIQPYEGKDITMTWYPIRLLGGLIEANKKAALNLIAEENGEISIRLNTTSLYKNSRIVLTSNGKEIFSESIEISPARPYLKDIKIDGPINREDLKFTFLDSSNETILEFQPKPKPGKSMPEALQPPPLPEDVKTVEELYLHGLRLDQFHNASISSYPYYYEALRRDPDDYRVNTQLGILYAKRKMYEKAEKHLQTAVDRITMRYTRPKDSDALYYLGVVQRRLNKNEEAYENFYAASWNSGWHTPAFHQLAEIDCQNGEFEKALDHINRAISTNSSNVKALGLKVTLLRKLGKTTEALELANSIIVKDPLHYHPWNELYLINREMGRNSRANSTLSELERIMRDQVQSYIEFATDYSNCGFYEEAKDVLSRLERKGEQFPMLYYYLGYYWSKLNKTDMARKYFAEARLKPHAYCFPFRDESVEVLQKALDFYPDDAMAYYYLGNLYYELQPELAVELWEKSLAIDNTFYIVQRNLAWAASELNDKEKAMELYGKAFDNHGEDVRLMYEYDNALSNAGISPEYRYEKIFRNNRHVSEQNSATYLREIDLLIFLGKYDEVIEILNKVEFIVYEGTAAPRDVFQNVYILRSLQRYKTGNYVGAIDDIKEALDFPIGRWGSERRAQMNFLLGTYYESAGNIAEAEKCFELAAGEIVDGTEFHYYKGLAHRKSGQPDKSREQFNALLEIANRSGDIDAFRSFEAGSAGAVRQAQSNYIRGLAYLGMGRNADAEIEFTRALDLNPAHLWASYMLAVHPGN